MRVLYGAQPALGSRHANRASARWEKVPALAAMLAQATWGTCPGTVVVVRAPVRAGRGPWRRVGASGLRRAAIRARVRSAKVHASVGARAGTTQGPSRR